jgi:hypothetical protein
MRVYEDAERTGIVVHAFVDETKEVTGLLNSAEFYRSRTWRRSSLRDQPAAGTGTLQYMRLLIRRPVSS